MKQFKVVNRFVGIAAVIAMTVASMSFSVPAEAAKAAKLSKTKLSLKVGSTASLKVSGKKIQSVSWKTSAKRIVGIKKKGQKKVLLKGKKVGKAKIKAVVKLNNKKKKTLTCVVTVKKKKGTLVPNSSPAVTMPVAIPSVMPPQPTPSATAVVTVSPSPEGPTVSPTLQPLDTIPEDELATCSYPMLFTDMPDPYICRKGDTYYMISTTMFLNPGAPIAKSTDLVNWQMAGYVYDELADDDFGNLDNGKDMYSHGSWAAALEYNESDGLFYVCFR